jgi:carbonic anhydrase
MTNADEMLAIAGSRAEQLAAPGLSPKPRRRVAVLACMDTRISVSQRKLGTEEIVVVMHDGCGLHRASEDEFAQALTADGVLPTWRLGAFEDVEETLRHSLARLRSSPELPAREHIRGFVFDPESGTLREVD